MGVVGLCIVVKLLVDGLSIKINRVHRGLRVLVHLSVIGLSRSALRFLARLVVMRRRELDTRRRRLTAGRQALPGSLSCGAVTPAPGSPPGSRSASPRSAVTCTRPSTP
ncbi:two-component response regulator [Streptomyces sp. NBRC 110611]|nr:two-component response regulator [Streptomyces sp. NBRC 110611]